MSVDVLEFFVVVTSAVIIVSAVYELARHWLRYLDDQREAERIEHWRNTRRTWKP